MAHKGGGVGFAHVQGPSETTLHQKGMKVTAPEPTDASTRCKGGSVNAGTTRSEVGKSHSIGGREA
jgi:hypothetical protein